VAGDGHGTNFVGGLRIQSNTPITVVVSFGDDNGLPDKCTRKQLALGANEARVVALCHMPPVPCSRLSLRVEALKLPDDGSARLTLDSLYLMPSLGELTRGLRLGSESFREANTRFRDGDISGALALYLLLHEKRELAVYQNNALMAARRLGMPPVSTVAALAKLMHP
jgi:hypothetical protein